MRAVFLYGSSILNAGAPAYFPTALSLVVCLVLLYAVISLMARRQKLVVVRVSCGGQTFRLPGKVAESEAEDARNVLVILIKQMGLTPASAARQPGLTQPISKYMVPDLDVVNVKQEWRGPMACALKVSEDELNSKAYIGCSMEVKVAISADSSRVTAQQQVQGGWDMLGSWQINQYMWPVVNTHPLACMQKHDTLFTAFALVHPRTFEGCIWDARQHAQEHAQPGLLLDYEYMPYEQYLRRRAVVHICKHWSQFVSFVKAEHGPGITSAADYFQLMLYKYSNTGLLTEALALCDIFGCGVDIVDPTSSRVYNLFPRNAPATMGRVSLLRTGGYYHVLLPGSATDVELPVFMSVSPQIVHGAQAQPMLYSRSVAVGVFGYSDEVRQVVPPVCLAMPPRPLQGASLTADPQPWSGDPDVSMFSFAFGTYIGLGSADLQDSDRASDDGNDQGSSSSSSGDGSSSGLSDSDSTSSTSLGCTACVDTPVLTIPFPDGRIAVARFMANAYFTFDNTCWQCGKVLPGYVHLSVGQLEACSCTSCKCKGCSMGHRPFFGCTAAGFIPG